MVRPLATLSALAVLLAFPAAAQTYPWPVEPFDEQHRISGTFCEYRDTSASGHFHNGVDIPHPDGQPVYPVRDGVVTSLSAVGSNAFVRVDDVAYVHVVPSPSLSVGDAVTAGSTVLGTIVSGLGHVHFVDGFVGSERQPLREGGGLAPYDDPWPPVISNVHFYDQPTRTRLQEDALAGLVEITFRVAEHNGPPGSSSSDLNNGAYWVGYKVLSADRAEEVFVPGDDGVVFRFDAKPSNEHVHVVFDRTQSTLSNHVYLPTNTRWARSALDTQDLAPGPYVVQLMAGDTRGNTDEVFVDVVVEDRDVVPPPPVTLRAALAADERAHLTWTGGEADDLAGYRVYTARTSARSGDDAFVLSADETVVGPDARAFTPDVDASEPTYVYVTAADATVPPNEGLASDVYAARHVAGGLAPVLVVDGFDRHGGSGSWAEPTHWFATLVAEAIDPTATFVTASNEAVVDGDVLLDEYDAVVWMLGDESTADETFSAAEQAHVRAYLEGGGRLLATGSEIAWDLDARGSGQDRAFLRDYLKVAYAGDDAGSLSVRGLPGGGAGFFDGLSFRYGSVPYAEDYPDYYAPVAGGQAVLEYANGRVAGVAYRGAFGSGTAEGRVMTLGFPIETVADLEARRALLERSLGYLLFQTDVDDPLPLPAALALRPPWPNPFADRASLGFALPAAGAVELALYDVLGRRVAVLADAFLPAGEHTVPLDGAGLAAGVYLVRLAAGPSVRTLRIVKAR